MANCTPPHSPMRRNCTHSTRLSPSPTTHAPSASSRIAAGVTDGRDSGRTATPSDAEQRAGSSPPGAEAAQQSRSGRPLQRLGRASQGQPRREDGWREAVVGQGDQNSLEQPQLPREGASSSNQPECQLTKADMAHQFAREVLAKQVDRRRVGGSDRRGKFRHRVPPVLSQPQAARRRTRLAGSLVAGGAWRCAQSSSRQCIHFLPEPRDLESG